MKDIRLKDNKALSLASETAKKLNKNLVILHVLSPGDYKAHDRAPCRIDWVLRNLKLVQVRPYSLHSVYILDSRFVQEELDQHNIPLAIRTIEKRKTIPAEVISLAQAWEASHIFANLEYEVDELRRDIALCELAQEAGNIETSFHHDYVLVQPGKVMTGAGKPYSVFSPFHRNWSSIMTPRLEEFSKDYPLPAANEDGIRQNLVLGKLFEEQVPDSVPGYELPSEEYKQNIHHLFPAGADAAEEVRCRLHT